jgi:hypothetical protein
VAEINRLGQQACRFLGGVKAERILGVDKVGPPLRLAMQAAGGVQFPVAGPGLSRRSDGVNRIDAGVFGPRKDAQRPRLDPFGPGEDLLLRIGVTLLAGPRNVQQGAAHLVVADFDCSLADVRHVAVGTGHAASGVNALRPHLELGMLSLEDRRAADRVRPVAEADLVEIGFDLLGLEPVVPRIGDELPFAVKVVLDVALAADERPHFLPAGLAVGVVVGSLGSLPPALDAGQVRHRVVRAGEGGDAVQKRRPRDAEGQRVGVVTVEARNRMFDKLPRLFEGHRTDDFKPPHDRFLPVCFVRGHARLQPLLAIGRQHRRMAVQTGPRLLDLVNPLGGVLVGQHVGVAAGLAIVDAEGIAGKQRPQPRVFVQPLERLAVAAAIAGPLAIDRPQIAVVLPRKVLGPLGRIDGVFGQVRQVERRLQRLLLAEHDVLVQRQNAIRRRGKDDCRKRIAEPRETAFAGEFVDHRREENSECRKSIAEEMTHTSNDGSRPGLVIRPSFVICSSTFIVHGLAPCPIPRWHWAQSTCSP